MLCIIHFAYIVRACSSLGLHLFLPFILVGVTDASGKQDPLMEFILCM